MDELWLIIFLLISSIVMIVFAIYALKIRKQVIKGLDEAAVKLADKFVGTNSGGMPPEKQKDHPIAKGVAQGVGAGVGYRMASGGKNDESSDDKDTSGTEREAQADSESKDTSTDKNGGGSGLSTSDSSGNGLSNSDSASFDGTGEESRADENHGRQLMQAESLNTGNNRNSHTASTSTNTVSSTSTETKDVKQDVSDSTIQKGLAGEIKPAATEKARTRSMDKAAVLEQRAKTEKNPEKAKQLYADAGYAYDKGGNHKLASSMYNNANEAGEKAEAENKKPSRAQKRAAASDSRSKQKHSAKQSDKYGYADAEGVELTYGDKAKQSVENAAHKVTSGARSKVVHKTANAADKISRGAKNTGKKLNDVRRQASQTRREITDETINVVKETRQRVKSTTKNVQNAVETQRTAKAAKAEYKATRKAEKKTLKSKSNDELS